jgi:hypothetical protein
MGIASSRPGDRAVNTADRSGSAVVDGSTRERYTIRSSSSTTVGTP